MKFTRNILTTAIVLAFVFCLNLTANAQRRRTPAKRTTTTTVARNTTMNVAEIKASAAKVSTQIKNVTRFIYLLGGIARGIEDIDKEAKTRRVSQTALSLNDTNKKNVIQSLKNLRAGLAALEAEFRTKPALRLYNFHIQGISDMSGQAEDLAAAGEFTESGKMLLTIVEKLSDTLVSLP
ncbi:MAG TPA: hypothetical protein VGD05_12775 [Pyrinomonadaceae bacterium]|jgi:hypothetical protein